MGKIELRDIRFKAVGADQLADNLDLSTKSLTLPATITANVVGNVTGNVTGNVSGNVIGDVSGNVSGSIFHASTHAIGGTDPITISSSQVTGLGTAATQNSTAFEPAGAASNASRKALIFAAAL
jgi:hypothetical protein